MRIQKRYSRFQGTLDGSTVGPISPKHSSASGRILCHIGWHDTRITILIGVVEEAEVERIQHNEPLHHILFVMGRRHLGMQLVGMVQRIPETSRRYFVTPQALRQGFHGSDIDLHILRR